MQHLVSPLNGNLYDMQIEANEENSKFSVSKYNYKTLFSSGTNVIGAHSMKEMVATLKKPRRVMMLVKAGSAVDAFIKQLVSFG